MGLGFILSSVCFWIAWSVLLTDPSLEEQCECERHGRMPQFNRRRSDRTSSGEEYNKTLRILAWTLEPGKRWSSNNILDGKCEFIDNKRDAYNTSDVVIFKAKLLKTTGLPSYRPPGQRWIYYEWESARNSIVTKFKSETKLNEVNVFNYSMTYSRTSDIYRPYGECQQLTSKQRTDADKQVNDIIVKKSRLVAWLVSNCYSTSRREKYVRELQKYIPIDIYGNCGPLTCNNDHDCAKHLTGYKFYLAFENSVCGEYITEKLWRSFEWGLVPVVYGGLDGYKEALPPHSYIDVSDFSSPENLAKYILQVHANDTLYHSYFSWKTEFQCGFVPKELSLEKICIHLHQTLMHSNLKVNLRDVWSHDSVQCIEANPLLKQLGVSDFSKVNFTIKQKGFRRNKN